MTKTPLLKTETYRVDRSHYSETLDQLHTTAQNIEFATTRLYELVRLASQEGATWADIGRELGVTRSAAQQRFGS
jgi:hypothetical protein